MQHHWLEISDRLEVTGRFGVVATSHNVASQVGMRMLEIGGNAFDAAVAAGLVLEVVDPNQCSAGGEVVILGSLNGESPFAVCGQGVTPERATIDHYREEGLSSIPCFGLLSAVVPGVFSAWMSLLRDYGTLSIHQILSPAISYARHGHILTAKASGVIANASSLFKNEWPSSAALYLPGGNIPRPGSLFVNDPLADTYERILRESSGASANREKQIESAIGAFYNGFVAEEIENFTRNNRLMDSSGERHYGVLTAQDISNWRATYEKPLSITFSDYEVYKAGPWSQGPVMLQMLSILKRFPLSDIAGDDVEFFHIVLEAMKLAFADREAWYGDPKFTEVPVATLLSDEYNNDRSKLINSAASFELRPGEVPGRHRTLPRYPLPEEIQRSQAIVRRTLAGDSADTCHLDIIDKWGNIVSATPSGGWLQSSPVISKLGFQLSNRAQMFWLEAGLPASLGPGRRPRTTLSPTLAVSGSRAKQMAFGCRGGDVQDQWGIQFFLRHILQGLGLQAAVDAPFLISDHCTRSEYPRQAHPGRVTCPDYVPRTIVDGLTARGHAVRVAGKQILLGYGQGCAASIENHILTAAATARLPDCSAVGR
jgi:gamma-glutamyltranspeptidase/glutathione hydrolase